MQKKSNFLGVPAHAPSLLSGIIFAAICGENFRSAFAPLRAAKSEPSGRQSLTQIKSGAPSARGNEKSGGFAAAFRTLQKLPLPYVKKNYFLRSFISLRAYETLFGIRFVCERLTSCSRFAANGGFSRYTFQILHQ